MRFALQVGQIETGIVLQKVFYHLFVIGFIIVSIVVAVAFVLASFAQPRALGHLTHVDAVRVKTPIAPVTKHHFVVVMRIGAVRTLFAFHALPGVLAYARPRDEFTVELQTIGMTQTFAGRARNHYLRDILRLI
jgi:hypothetical protein